MKKRLKGLLAVVMAAAMLFSTASLTASAAQSFYLGYLMSIYQITYTDAYAGDSLSYNYDVCGFEYDFYIVEEGKTSDGESAYYYYSERMNTEANGASKTGFSSEAAAEQFAAGASVTPDRRFFSQSGTFILPANSDGYYKYSFAVIYSSHGDVDRVLYVNTYDNEVWACQAAVIVKEVPCSFTVTFDANDGAGSMDNYSGTYDPENCKLPANKFTRDGYNFAGWNTQPDGTGKAYADKASYVPKENEEAVTLYAQWVATHKITYYIAKGAEAYETATYAEGADMTHPDVGEISGIVYKGWADADGNAIPDKMGTSDIEAYAVVDYVKKYKATYVVDGTKYKEYEIPVGSAITVPDDPEIDGFVFTGWTPTIPQYMPASALTFVATFEKAPEKNEYTATYKVDGKTHKSYVIKEGDAMQIPDDPEKFGYTFVGWEPEVPDTMPGHDVEFEAQWEVDKTFTTVVIGGTVIAGGVAAAAAGLNAAWITGVSIVGGVLVIAGTSALIKNTHTVTYMVDGEVYKTYKVVKGAKIPVPAEPTKDGEQFKGWTPEVPEKMGDTDLTFEAVWESTEIPDTGSTAGITAFAVVSGAMAAAYILMRKKKED